MTNEKIVKSYKKLIERFGNYAISQIIDFGTYQKQCETFGIKAIEKEVIFLIVE